MSRMQQDLSSAPHGQETRHSFKPHNGDAPMLRKAAGKVPHVGIVGAGVAGLRCADVLLRRGAKVTIIEGRDRIGGRLCQSKVHGHMVDLGPNWIHGTDSNPILDLAKETNTVTMSWDGRQSVFDRLGNLMTETDSAENTEIVWTIIEQAMKYSNESSDEIPAAKSLYNYFEEKLESMFPLHETDLESKEKREIILQMAEMWGAFVGSPIQIQSLKFFWLEECIDGENLFVAETYHKVLARIAEPALRGARVLFNKTVTRISTDSDMEDPRVRVSIRGEDALDFDEVVMTAPLGWLKRNNDAFVPKLTPRLKKAIDSIGYGHLDKIYITFPKPFWNESPSNNTVAAAMPHQQSAPNVTATTAPLHSSPTTRPTYYPGFTHWAAPSYVQSTNPSRWNQECVNLAALPSHTAHPTLLFYTFGPTSLHIASVLSKYASPTTDLEAQKFLTEFFTPYFSRLPNYSPSDPAHQPQAILATLWANDELAGYGSYANFQTGLEKGDEDIEVMRQGMPERGVWLAGEHTAPFVALGTVTGAYWAGEGVAKRIVNAYKLEIK